MGKNDASSTLCYVKDADYAWVPAILEKTEGDKAYVKIPQYRDQQSIMSDGGRGTKGEPVQKVINLKDYPHKVLPLQNVDKNGNLMEEADMVKLAYLHEVRIYEHFSNISTYCKVTVTRLTSPLIYFFELNRLQFFTT